MIDSTVQSRLAAFPAAALLVVLFCVGTVEAQPEPTDDAPPMRARLINPSDLELTIIDSDGRPQLLLGHRLKDAQEILRLLEGKQDDEQIIINGTVEVQGMVHEKKGYWTADVTYAIQLTERGDADDVRWVRVPLNLDHALVDAKSVRHAEPGEFFLHKDEAGYVAWLKTKPDSSHTIQLQAKIPIAKAGGVRTLNLKLPNMSTVAQISVQREGIVVERQDQRSLLSTEAADGKTQIHLENNGGGINVGWTDRRKSRPLIEVNGTIRVDIHANDVTADAKLSLRSRGEPIDTFVVYLPPGMELATPDVLGFQLSSAMDEDRGQRAVTVRRTTGATSDVIDVQLGASLPAMNRARPNRTLQVAGFEVEGADRQRGTIDVMVRGDWSVTWTPDAFVQPEPYPSDTDKASLAARFVYDRQPFALELDMRRKQPRVSVVALYTVVVSQQRATLDANLQYQTTGKQKENIQLDIAGWQIDGVELAGDAVEDYVVDANGLMTVPLESSANSLELRVHGHQPLAAEDGEFAVPMPRPTDLAQPPRAHVLVIADENIELTPLLAESTWLVEDELPDGIEIPTQATAPLCYREELSAETTESSQFAARKQRLTRTVDVAIASEANLQNDRVVLKQELTLAVAYEALREFVLYVPAEVIQSNTLQLSIDGEDAPYQVVQDSTSADAASAEASALSQETQDDESSPNEAQQIRVDLLRERTGDVVLVAEYEVLMSKAANGAATRIPLLRAAEDESVTARNHLLEITASDSIALDSADEIWTRETDIPEEDAVPNRLRLRSSAASSAANILTSPIKQRTQQSLIVSQAWVQMLLANDERSDRVVYRLVSDDPQLLVQLPDYADVKKLEVGIDGRLITEHRVDDAKLLRITQPAESVGREVTLELFYPCDATRSVELPEVQDAERVERVYWEIAMPRDRHLAWSPDLLTPELVWKLDGLYWGPRGRLEERQLEELLGASSRSVATNMNRYLFSSSGAVTSTTFTPIRRVILMLVFSAIVLLGVLPFFYVEPLRRPAVYLVIGVLLIGLAVTYPESAVMCGQAGAIGVVLALLACLLQRMVGSQPPPALPTTGSLLIPHDSQAPTPIPALVDGSSRATTATAPAHLQAHPDSRS